MSEIDRLRVIAEAARALINADRLMTDDASSRFDDLVAAVAACEEDFERIAAVERGADKLRESIRLTS